MISNGRLLHVSHIIIYAWKKCRPPCPLPLLYFYKVHERKRKKREKRGGKKKKREGGKKINYKGRKGKSEELVGE